jgi:hypothetical protein
MSILARTPYLASKAQDIVDTISAPIEQFNEIANISTEGQDKITERFDGVKEKMIAQNGGSTQGIEEKIAKIDQKKSDALNSFNSEIDNTKQEAESNITGIVENSFILIKGVSVSLSVSGGIMTPTITPDLFSVDTDLVDQSLMSPDTQVIVPGNPPGTIITT